MQLLEKQKVLVTGASSGIGKAIAILFATQGADVAIWGTNPERLAAAEKEISMSCNEEKQEILSQIVDVSQTANVEIAIESLLQRWQNIDVLVNNAGITRDALLMRMTEDNWDDVMDTNLKSVFNTCRYVIKTMLKQRKGKIINISSVVGLTGNAGQGNYAASKAGVIGFTKSLAQEVAKRGICVNCIAPGYIITPMTEKLPEAIKQSILEKIPMQRFGLPKDIANAALFFASHFADYVTGQVFCVDGGMTK